MLLWADLFRSVPLPTASLFQKKKDIANSSEKKSLDLAEEMVMVEGMESDEELLLARDLTSFFLKTFKAIRFYPPDNPTIKGFRDQLLKKF